MAILLCWQSFTSAITVMTELFWNKKGTVTGIVATAAGLAAILLPLATGLMSKTGHISIIFIFDAMLSVVGMAAAAFVNYRYRKILNKTRSEQIQATQPHKKRGWGTFRI